MLRKCVCVCVCVCENERELHNEVNELKEESDNSFYFMSNSQMERLISPENEYWASN
jgi:hypothetical protein